MENPMDAMPTRLRALLFLNGALLIVLAVVTGWIWMFALLNKIVLWPLPIDIPVAIPDDGRGWRMAHVEAITEGLLLMAVGLGGRFMRLSLRQYGWLFWSSIVTGWFFSVPPIFNALFGTRGLAFGGGPFKGGAANDVIYLFGWPPVVAVHIMLALVVWGVWRYLKSGADFGSQAG
jgi:hypothetical protein